MHLGDILVVIAGLCLLALAFIVPGAIFARRSRWRRAGYCRCGYPTLGLVPGQPCPECGTPLINSTRQPFRAGRQRRPLPVFLILLIAPVLIGAAMQVIVHVLVVRRPEALITFSPVLLPFLIHAIPVLVLGRWAPAWLLALAALAPPLASALFIAAGFATDWLGPPQHDDVFHPYTLFLLSAVLTLPWSLACSAGLVWAAVLTRPKGAAQPAIPSPAVVDPPEG